MPAVVSPLGRVSLDAGTDSQGALFWQVFWDDKAVTSPSSIAISLPSGLLHKGLVHVSTVLRDIHDPFPILSGKSSSCEGRCQEATLTFEHPAGAKLDIILRAYDDAAALRWVLTTPTPEIEVLGESVSFTFPEDHDCWAISLPHFQTSFEGEYDKAKLSEIRTGDRKGLPLLVKAGPCWAAILESAVENHAGILLSGRPGPSVVTELSPSTKDPSSPVAVRASSPHSSPWRVILLAEEAAKLNESNTVAALNPPSRLEDTSWIKPGLVTWDWWCGPCAPKQDFEAGMNTRTFEHFVDFAADYGLPYCMIDGGWYGGSAAGGGDSVVRSVPELDVPHVIRYAKSKGVDILLWLHSEDLRRELDLALQTYEEWGAKGLKIDFFDRCDQDVIAYCHEILEKTARHHLMVNFHGIFTPLGWDRTYPHLLTSEGVLGAEYSKWSKRVTPRHNVTLAYTRALAGPLDYTVGSFLHSHPETFSPRGTNPITMGTRAHQLALFVVFQSGLQMVSETPDCVRGQKGEDFLRNIPVAWDETKALGGEVGEHITLARRKGSQWFVAGITGDEGRTFDLDLSWLPEGAKGTLYTDGANAESDPSDLDIRQIDVKGTLSVKAHRGGGFVLVCEGL